MTSIEADLHLLLQNQVRLEEMVKSVQKSVDLTNAKLALVKKRTSRKVWWGKAFFGPDKKGSLYYAIL